MRFFAHFMFAANLLIATAQVHATAYNQPAVDTDPTRKLYDAGHPTQAVNLPDGSIILVGDFNHYAGVRVDGIVKLSSSGEVDLGFLPQLEIRQGGPSAIVESAAVVGEYLYVLGTFYFVNSSSKARIARFALPALTLDEDWYFGNGVGITGFIGESGGALVSASGDGSVSKTANDGTLLWSNRFDGRPFDLTVLANGNVSVLTLYGAVGFRIRIFDGSDGQLIHLLNTPDLDMAWYQDFAATPDGDLLVAGDFHALESGPQAGLARIDGVTGMLDPAWSFTSDDPRGAFGAVLATPDGGAIVSGSFTQINGTPTLNGLARISPDGSIVPSWGGAVASSDSRLLAKIDDERFLLVTEPRSGDVTRATAARFDNGATAGTFESSDLSSDAIVNQMKPYGEGLLIAGDFQRSAFHASVGLLKLDGDLGVDTSFSPDFSGYERRPPVKGFGAGDGYLHSNVGDYEWLAGPEPGGAILSNMILHSADTGARLPLSPTVLRSDNSLNASAVFNPADQHFYVVTATTNPPIHMNLLRYDPSTGIVDSDWSQISMTASSSFRSAVIANGYFYAGGYSSFGGQLVRVPTETSGPVENLAPSTGYPGILQLATDSNQEWVYLAGYASATFDGLARISSTTGLVDASWRPMSGAGGNVTAIDVTSDGDIYLGGSITGFACDPDRIVRAVRLRGDGGIDPTWHIELDTNALGVRSIAEFADGRVLVGGSFESINGVDQAGFAVVSGETDVIFVDQLGDRMCIP